MRVSARLWNRLTHLAEQVEYASPRVVPRLAVERLAGFAEERMPDVWVDNDVMVDVRGFQCRCYLFTLLSVDHVVRVAE